MATEDQSKLSPNPPIVKPKPEIKKKKSGVMMDEMRKRQEAYEYLCHLEEIKQWLESCIKEELPPSTELENKLRNGVFLAKLANFMTPQLVPLTKIYDIFQERYADRGLEFRHTDNINFWVNSMKKLGLPKLFYPTTTDLYDKKNMPRVIYCLHALSLFLNKLGKGPVMENLVGEAEFTEEEISVIAIELDSYNIKMPAFGKINGVLTEHLTQDQAAIHAAIMAVNEAIDNDDPAETLSTLRNPAVQLEDWLRPEMAPVYHEKLHEAKASKREKSGIDDGVDSNTLDAYDYNLTREEIQDCVEKVNNDFDAAQLEFIQKEFAQLVNDAVAKSDRELLLEAISDSTILYGVVPENIVWYLDIFSRSKQEKYEQEGNSFLSVQEIQGIIKVGNDIAETSREFDSAIVIVNEATQEGDLEKLGAALMVEVIEMDNYVHEYQEYYMKGLQTLLTTKPEGQLLNEIEIKEVISQMNEEACKEIRANLAIEKINESIGTQETSQMLINLLDQDANLAEITPATIEEYSAALLQVQKQKSGAQLNRDEIQNCVVSVNTAIAKQKRVQELVTKMSKAVTQQNPQQIKSLLAQALNDQDLYYIIEAEDACTLYLKVITNEATKNPGQSLSLEQLQGCVIKGNLEQETALLHAKSIEEVNTTVINLNPHLVTFAALQNPHAFISSISQECSEKYQTALYTKYTGKNGSGEFTGRIIALKSTENRQFWFNIETRGIEWTQSDNNNNLSSYLSKDEIQIVVNKVTADHSRWTLFQSNENFIIKLQALVRGFLIRKPIQLRNTHFNGNIDKIIILQAHIKCYLQRKKYRERLEFINQQVDTAIVLQKFIRGWLVRDKIAKRNQHFINNIASVIKIQSWYRTLKAKESYQTLVSDTNPPVGSLKKFLSLLDQSDGDIREELEVNSLRGELASKIRHLKFQEIELNNFDIKIGLLIRNQITLKDVIHTSSKVQRRKERIQANKGAKHGIKEFTASSRKILNGYQHLFYLIQTNPNYLARTMYIIPITKSNEFIENVVLALYNYGSNTRETFLFTKMIEVALREEIDIKVHKPADVNTMNSIPIKILIKFIREGRSSAHNTFKQLLVPLVEEVISSQLKLFINAVEVYKQWVSVMETLSGSTSQLPYEISATKAMEHSEVRDRIEQTFDILKPISDKFITAICDNPNRLPYPMRYTIKVIRETLEKQFPDAPEDSIIKVLSNIIYYRYINPMIVNPESYGLVTLDPTKGSSSLPTEQRKNLSSLAKLLQSISTRKQFSGEDTALAILNPYIREKYEIFKAFVYKVSSVNKPEEKFGYDEFTDLITISKPVVRLQAKDIISTHKLILEHLTILAPDEHDCIHDILQYCGEPNISHLIGEVSDLSISQNASEDFKEILVEAYETEIALLLSPKDDGIDRNATDPTDLKAIFVQTKGMVVDVLKVQPMNNLVDVMQTEPTEEMCKEFEDAMLDQQIKGRQKGEGEGLLLRRYTSSQQTEYNLPTLPQIKAKIRKNLDLLEKEGLIHKEDQYQDIINAIAKDITNQARHRKQRRNEKNRIHSALKNLNEKAQFQEKQNEFYQQYIQSSLQNMAKITALRSGHPQKGATGEQAKRKTIKYTAKKLYDKGVIIEIEGVQKYQYRSIQLEISQIDNSRFEVSARFFGKVVEKTELVFEDILQFQFDGVGVCKIGNQVKVNVNLLIFLINKKLYGRST